MSKTFRFLGFFGGGSIVGQYVTIGLRHALDFSTFSLVFTWAGLDTPRGTGTTLMIEWVPPLPDKQNVLNSKNLVDYLEMYKADIKQELLNDFKSSCFNEASNPHDFLIKKTKTDSILRLLQSSQQYFYIFIIGGLVIILFYSSLADLNRSTNLASVNHKINIYNQPCSLNELQIYENEKNKRDIIIGQIDFKKSNIPYKVHYFFQKIGQSLYYFLKKTEWVFYGLKLYKINLVCPTLFLKDDFCNLLYERQKNQENHVSLETITNDFILLRTFFILQMEQLARDCFLLGLSQVAFQGLLFICKNYFFNSFISKFYIFWVLKNKNPFIACFFGFSFFLVNKQLFAIISLLLTKCILFFYTKLIELQQAIRDFKKTKGECKNYDFTQ